MLSTKFCPQCKTEKPTDEFGNHKNRPDGLQSWCKKCKLQDQKRRRWEQFPHRREASELRTNGLKRCGDCGETKSISEFYPKKRGGTDSICKQCALIKGAKWYKENPEAVRRINLRKKYGMDVSQYDALLAEQGGVCAVCGSSGSRGKYNNFHVDHDHETRAIRGLLCNVCNTGIGMLGDSVEGLQRAIDYLSRASKKSEKLS